MSQTGEMCFESLPFDYVFHGGTRGLSTGMGVLGGYRVSTVQRSFLIMCSMESGACGSLIKEKQGYASSVIWRKHNSAFKVPTMSTEHDSNTYADAWRPRKFFFVLSSRRDRYNIYKYKIKICQLNKISDWTVWRSEDAKHPLSRGWCSTNDHNHSLIPNISSSLIS